MDYAAADRAIKDMNRRSMRTFDRLRTLKFDELNVTRMVTAVYEDLVRIAKRRFLIIALDAYEAALIEAGFSPEEAELRAEESITEDWVLDMLEEYDPVTLYRFDTEVERKKQRLIEALLATNSRNDEIDRALRQWSKMFAQYADNVTVTATIDAFEDAGIEKVRWVSEGDAKVCAVCRKLDGKVFRIGKIPPVPHWGCRCTLVLIK